MSLTPTQIANRAGKRAKKGKGGISKVTMTNIRKQLGGSYNAADIYNRMNRRQRQVATRLARREGKTLAGVLGGGPSKLQERSAAGIRRGATRTMNKAYHAGELSLDTAESKAKALNATQTAADEYYNKWLVGEQAKMSASAAQADAELRTTNEAITNEANARWEAAPGALAEGGASATNYGQQGIELARQASQGEEQARQVRSTAEQGQRADFNNMLRANVLGQATADRSALRTRFAAELQGIADDRKVLKAQKAGDIWKEISRLQDQAIDVASANRDYRLQAKSLNLKEFETRAGVKQDKGELRLATRQFLQKLTDDQLDRALRQAEIDIKSGNLSVAEEAQRERARHNLQTEKNDRAGGGGAGGNVSAGQHAVWNKVANAYTTAQSLVKKYGMKDPAKLAYELRKRTASPLYAKAAAQMALHGKIDRATRLAIRDAGGFVPAQWR